MYSQPIKDRNMYLSLAEYLSDSNNSNPSILIPKETYKMFPKDEAWN